MSQVFLTVLDTSPVTINDLGGVTYPITTSNLALIEPSGEFSAMDVANSQDLITQENLGNISLTDSSGKAITDSGGLESGSIRDENAIHVNSANEISSLTLKTTPVAGDLLVIEDSQDSFNKKGVDVDSLIERTVGASVPGVWNFDDSTTMSNPGSKDFRLNNSNPASVTQIAIHENSESDFDFSTIFAALPVNTRFYIQEIKDSANFILLRTTDTGTDNGSWWLFDVAVEDNGLLFDDGEECGFTIFGGGGALADLPAIAWSITSDVTVNTTPGVITWTNQIVQNDTAILERDGTNQSRFNIKKSGLFALAQNLLHDASGGDLITSRIILNGNSGVPIAGTEFTTNPTNNAAAVTPWTIMMLSANDYLEVEHEISANTGNINAPSSFAVVALRGTTGEKGNKGDPGTPGTNLLRQYSSEELFSPF